MFDSMVQVAGYGQDGKVYVTNSSGEEIPPFSLVKISGAVEPFTGTKPDADNIAPSLLVTNGPGKVGAGDTFRAALCSSGQIQVDMNGENPGSEANVGSTEDQWYGTEGNIGFKCLGASGGYALLGPFSGAVLNQYKFSTNNISATYTESNPITQRVYTSWSSLGSTIPCTTGDMISIHSNVGRVSAQLNVSYSAEPGQSPSTIISGTGSGQTWSSVNDYAFRSGEITKYRMAVENTAVSVGINLNLGDDSGNVLWSTRFDDLYCALPSKLFNGSSGSGWFATGIASMAATIYIPSPDVRNIGQLEREIQGSGIIVI